MSLLFASNRILFLRSCSRGISFAFPMCVCARYKNRTYWQCFNWKSVCECVLWSSIHCAVHKYILFRRNQFGLDISLFSVQHYSNSSSSSNGKVVVAEYQAAIKSRVLNSQVQIKNYNEAVPSHIPVCLINFTVTFFKSVFQHFFVSTSHFFSILNCTLLCIREFSLRAC